MSSRARTRSRTASSSQLGTRTGRRALIIKRRTNRSAARWSPLTLSCAGRSIFPGAAITQSTPTAASARASPNPVGPASYATRVGPGSAAQNLTTPLVSPERRCTIISPDSASTTHATTVVACTPKPTQVRTSVTVGSSHAVAGRCAGSSCAATNLPHDRGGDRPASTTPAGRQPPYGLANILQALGSVLGTV